MRFLFFFVFVISSISHAQNSDEVLFDAQSSFLKGELFSSYRLYLTIIDKNPQKLKSSDVENFVSTAQVINTIGEFEDACKRLESISNLKDAAAFSCGKVFMKLGKYEDAQKYFNSIANNYLPFDVSIFKITNDLNHSERQNCLTDSANLDKLKSLSTENQELKTITQARCKLALSKYAESIRVLHELNPSSAYYLSSLQEQAWSQFKKRDLESSKELINVLMSIYESKNKQVIQSAIPDNLYYESKYLRAYIDLIMQNSEKSKKRLAELFQELKRYKTKNTYNDQSVLQVIKLIHDVDSIPKLQAKQYSLLGKVRNYIASWAANDSTARVDDQVRFLVAVNKEISRVQVIKNVEFVDQYILRLQKLKKAAIQTTAQTIYAGVKNAERSIESLSFKANMGQLENYWADQTEGKRSLADVIDDYKFGIMQVEDYLGK